MPEYRIHNQIVGQRRTKSNCTENLLSKSTWLFLIALQDVDWKEIKFNARCVNGGINSFHPIVIGTFFALEPSWIYSALEVFAGLADG